MSISHLNPPHLLLQIKSVLESYLLGCSIDTTMDNFLKLIVNSTNSTHGFIGIYQRKNSPDSFKTVALSKLSINQETAELYKLHCSSGLELSQLQKYVGDIKLTTKPVNTEIINSDFSTKYLGVPIELSGNINGYIGVFNKREPYGPKDLKTLDLVKDSLFAIIKFNSTDATTNNASPSVHQIPLDDSEMGFWEWNSNAYDNDWQNTQEEWWSPNFYRLLGYEENEIPSNSSTFISLIHPDDREITFRKFSSRDIGKDFDQYDIKHRLRYKNGTYRWFRSRGKVIKEDNIVIKMTGSIRDIHEEYILMKSLQRKTSRDDLTGLPNRQSFISSISKLFKDNPNSNHILAIIDIEQFSILNSLHGNEFGDQVIKYISRFIKERLRKKDLLARIGGDEFGLIISDCSVNNAKIILNSILTNLELEHTVIQGKEIKLSICIGISPVDNFSKNYEQYITQANSACKQAKLSGSEHIKVYNADDSEIISQSNKISYINRVRSAIKHKEIKLFAQPIVRVASKEKMQNSSIRHFEILTRLKENDELISPKEFMPTVEGYRLSSEYDRYLINQFCNWYRTSKQLLPDNTKFSINLSGQSMSDQRVFDLIIRNINAFSIPPDAICLEITETAAINNMAHAKRFIDSLREQGLQFSLDDFGQGLSTFSYLKELPVDFLKIDGQFIKKITTCEKDRAIVQSINKVGKTIGYSTVAECVENEDTLEIIRELDIDFVQGYLFGKPIPLEDILSTYLHQEPLTQPIEEIH